MIHYHGLSDAGPDRVGMSLAFQGRHVMVSFAYKQTLPRLAPLASSFVLDCGAYTTWKQGKAFEYSAYLEWVYEWKGHPGFDWCIVPDVIGGGEDEQNANLERWPVDLAAFGVPVWHPAHSINRFVGLCQQYPRVSIGAYVGHRPGSKSWWMRIREAFDAITDNRGYPMAKIHGLRLLDPKIFTRLPLASADSTSAERRANRDLERWGIYPPPSPRLRVEAICERIEAQNSAVVWQKSGQTKLI